MSEVWMTSEYNQEYKSAVEPVRNMGSAKSRRGRLARELFNGRYECGEILQLSKIASAYDFDEQESFKAFWELQSLGLVTLEGKKTATVKVPDPKEMRDAYEIRAALEEIAGRAAAPLFKGSAGRLRYELAAMRACLEEGDFDAFAEHDVQFHRVILRASQNSVLIRVWDALAVDLRMQATIGKSKQNLQEIVESYQPIVEALDRGQGREAGLLLRSHVETVMHSLRTAALDSSAQQAVIRDLETARDVQTALFPRKNVAIPGLDYRAFYKPARDIGGDYYDLFPLPGDTWGMAIGDVAGKGIGAALIVASLQASLRAQALNAHSDLVSLMAEVDRLVYASSPQQFYASLFYGEYQPETRILEYVNAGHNPPMILRWKSGDYRVFRLEAGGTPIGLLEKTNFAADSFQIEPGDVLVAYTDGITESESPASELWGQERLERVLRKCKGETSEEIIQRILDERFAFASGQPQRDDMTVLVIRSVE
jgi:serine phosphatase RsbU (regulator of sigma subunit)